MYCSQSTTVTKLVFVGLHTVYLHQNKMRRRIDVNRERSNQLGTGMGSGN